MEPKYYFMWKQDMLGPGFSMRSFNKPEDVEDFSLSLHQPHSMRVIAGYEMELKFSDEYLEGQEGGYDN